MKVVLVDDEALARRRLARLLEREPDVEIVAECVDGRDAVRVLSEQTPDLVFLDVQMPEMDGFEVIRAVGPDACRAVVFVTGFDQYALKAFEVQAFDYLLKPFTDERLHQALERVRGRLRTERLDELADRLGHLLEAVPARRLSRLGLRAEGKVRFVDVERIDWIEADGKTVRVHTGDEVFTLRESIGSLEARLDPARFARIHRSVIVHLDRIESIESAEDGARHVTLRGGEHLPLSRANRLKVLDLLVEEPAR